MIRLSRSAPLLAVAVAIAACSVNESGNIPCTDVTNCPAAYPTCSSHGFCVEAAGAASIVLTLGDAQSAVSGSALAVPLTVQVLDSNGNPFPNFSIDWTASTGSSVSSASTTTGPDGKSQVTGTVAKTNGTSTFTAAGAGLSGSPVHFTATGVSGPAATIAGTAGANQTGVAGALLGTPLAALVTDANANPVAGATVTWAATAGGGSVTLATTTTALDGTTSTVAKLGKTVGANTYTASASQGTTALTNSPVTYAATGIAGAVASFKLTGPSSTIAGVVQSFTLTAQDANANVAVTYRGTATFSSNDTNAALPAAHTFTAADAGVLVFSATLKTAGTRSVTATDALLVASASGIVVSPAAAASLVVAGFTSPISADATSPFGVTAQDAFGNVATGYRGTVAFSTDNAQGTLPASYVFTAGDAGARSFTGQLSEASAVATFRVTATDAVTATIAGSQTAITVNPGAPTTIAVGGFPAAATAGVAGSVLVTVKDVFGNAASQYRGTVHFVTTNPNSTVPADYAFTAGDAGSRSFSATLTTASASSTYSISATDSATASITGVESGITVNPAAAATFIVAGFTTTIAADATSTFSVTAKDAFGNIATGYRGTVAFTSDNTQPALPSNYTYTSGDAGVHSFSGALNAASNLVTFKVTATDTVTSSVTGSQTGITVNPGAANTISVAGFPTAIAAGVSGFFVVTVKDAFGNQATGYLGTVHFASTDGAATVPGNYAFIAGDAGSRTFSATLRTSSNITTYSISATDTVTASITGSETGITVNPAPASHFTVTGFPATVTSGVSGSVTVTARDSSNNVAIGYLGTVHFTSNNSNVNTSLPADYHFTVGDAGVHTFASGAVLATAGTGFSITATDTVTGTITGAQTGITVNPGTAVKLSVTGLAGTTVAGVVQAFTVTAQDASNNTATGYTGTVHFTSTDGQISAGSGLPANYHFTAGDAGVHAFSATLKTVGSQTITATDTVAGTITGISSTCSVTPAAAASFIVTTTAGSPQTAGVAFSVTVTAKDAFTNTATGYAGTVHFTSTDGSAILPGDTTLSSGAATLGATLETVGSRTITATDTVTGTITGTSPAVTVGPAAAVSFTVVASPTPITAGVALSTVVVTAKDAFGNTATGYSGTVHLTSTDGQVAVPADATLTSGTRTYSSSVTLKTVGSQTVTATDTVSAGITGVSNVVTVNPAAAATYLVVPASNSQTAGVAFNFTVTAKDAFGNTATGYLGTAHFTSTDGQATAGTGLPANYHFLVGDAGVKTFSATLKTSPSQTITGTDTSSGTITGTTASITVAPSSTTTLTVTAGLAQNAGTPFNVTVTAKDAFGNTATGYTGTVHITTTDGAATPPADNTLASGVGTFSVTLKTVGTFSVTGTDTVTGTINGTQSGIVVGPANAATFTVTTTAGGSQTAGATFNVTVTAKDGFGNTATGYLGTVHFTSTDGQVSAGSGLPSNYHFLIGDAGVHTFTSVLLKTVGSTQTITATDTVTGTLTGTSPSINVVPAATSVLVLSPQGSSQTAGVAFNVIVTAKDPFGNTTPLYAGTVHFISTDGQATSGAGLPTDTTLTSGTATLLSTLKTAGPQTITGTDTVAGTITGTSSSITVLAAGTSTFALTATTPEVAGTSFGLTVTAKDPFGNTTSGYGGTVHITSTDPAFISPSDAALVSGVKLFTVTLKTTPSQTLTATDTSNATLHGTSSSITVNPGATTTLTVSPAATTQTAAIAFNLTITAKDSSGNTTPAYLGTVHFTSTDGAVSAGSGLPSNYIFTGPDAGVKILSTTLKTAGSQTITATDVNTGAINGTTPGITVNVGATSTLTVVPAAFTQTAGTAFNVTVTAKDAGGNTTTGYGGTVQFTSTDGAVSPGSGLPNPYHFIGADSGVHVFSVTLQTSGARTVTATDNVTGAINGTTGSITVNPGAAASLTVAPAGTTQTAAIAFNVTVTARDAFGNTATGYAGTVQFTSTDGAVSPGSGLPINYHFLGGDLGVKTLSVTLKTAGPQTVTATDNVTGTINGTTPSITVNVGATSTFLVVPGAFTQTAGSSFSVTVTAKDAGGNTTTTYTGTAHFNSTDLAVVGGSGLPMDYQFTSGGGLDNGVHVFTVTLKTVGTQTITVMDFNTLAITGTSGSITVNPGATTKLAVKGTSSIVAFPPGVVQGIANIVTVVAQDANNNTTPAYVGTVHFTTSDGAVSAGSGLPANYQFTSGGGMDNGIHVYSGGATLLTVNATASITATDTANGTINGAVTINVVAAPLVFQSAAAMIVGGSRDGQVFITGGSTTNDNAGTSTASTYFYNPSTGTMLPGPNMALARYAHTATATTGGQIVVAGGNYAKIGSIDHFEFELCGTDGASPSCAEVTGSTGSAKDTQRCNAAAALVRAGTVVIGGGDNCAGGGFLDQLDVWDSGAPTTTTFVNGVGHQFAVARHFHTATALGSSKVLFAGGGSTASADIFTLVVPPNIANSTVVATTAGMLVTRSGHSATTLRTTGTTACPVGPCVLIAGGNATAAKTWEIYDASTDTFPRNATTAGHDLQLAGRNEHAAAGFNNGRVLLAGGSNTPTGGGTAQSSTEYFDPAALTFSTFSALSETRLHPGFAYVTTDLLIVIGGNTTTPTLVLGSPVDQASTP